MPQYTQEYLSQYDIKKIYALITNIEAYPDFLPWCSEAKIINKSKNTIIADLSITFKYLTEKYRSEVKLKPIKAKKATIEASMISGPFKYLNNRWELSGVGDGTLIKFNIDFCFKSVVLQKIIGIFFYKACEKMLAAFTERANELYGK